MIGTFEISNQKGNKQEDNQRIISECKSLVWVQMKGWLTDIFSTKGMESKEGFCFQYFCLILCPNDDRISERGCGETEGGESDVHNATITSFVLLCQFHPQVGGRKCGKNKQIVIMVSGKHFIPALEGQFFFSPFVR